MINNTDNDFGSLLNHFSSEILDSPGQIKLNQLKGGIRAGGMNTTRSIKRIPTIDYNTIQRNTFYPAKSIPHNDLMTIP